MARFTAADIPPQSGRSAVVTGANSGLGAVTAKELARAGAQVVIACRNLQKGERAAEDIRRSVPGASLAVMELDLADLESVRTFSAAVGTRHPELDLLINNAGVMAPPRRLTVDGFESQIGTNHLGHFALTAHLLEALGRAHAPRVVTLSSGAHRMGRIKLDDLQSERRYNNWMAYGQSKLANLMFCFELQRRATAAGMPLVSVAAHPGYAATNLQFAGPSGAVEKGLMAVANRVVAQSAEMGALPTLYAATVQDIPPAAFVGPDGLSEMRGYPHIVTGAGKAYDEETAAQLWELSEELTGEHFRFPVAAA